MKPRFVIDKNIPYIRGIFDEVADVTYLCASDIIPKNIADINALIVRTRTKCNASLLAGSTVEAIATATIGTDHIDTEYCDNNHIKWQNAPGCNATSVSQYFASAIAEWSKYTDDTIEGKTVGIVGYGHIGRKIEKVAKSIGLKILYNDPPLAQLTNYTDKDSCCTDIEFVDLETIARECDIITFHTPLTYKGEHHTYHLADSHFFDKISDKKPLIINAARGGIIDEVELIRHIDSGKINACIIDCWENEPAINTELMKRALIATPHIAGYSADGKNNATHQVVKFISEHFNIKPNTVESLSKKRVSYTSIDELMNLFLNTYNIKNDSEKLKENHTKFEELRSSYPERREYIIRKG
ncbi:MAG: 4-phosphoerythronate dehydrogenase [bacterium]